MEYPRLIQRAASFLARTIHTLGRPYASNLVRFREIFQAQEEGKVGLSRYWFEFSTDDDRSLPAGVGLGCGVSANGYDDAIQLLRDNIFDGGALPPIVNHISDVDVSELDAAHVLPNMGDVLRRGVWFPLGYE